MIDHKATTEVIKSAIVLAETLLQDWLWAAAHVQHYDHLIKQAEHVPPLDVPVSIAEWVAHQQKLDAAREMSGALWRLKEPHRLAEQNAFWELIALLPAGQPFIIVAFNARYHVEARRNEIIVKRGDLP